MGSTDPDQGRREPVIKELKPSQRLANSKLSIKKISGVHEHSVAEYRRTLDVFGIKQTYLLLFVMVTTFSAIEILLFLPFQPQIEHAILIVASLLCQACWLYSPKMATATLHYLISGLVALIVSLAFVYITYSHLPELHVLSVAGVVLALIWLITLTGIERWQSAVIALIVVCVYLFALTNYTTSPLIDVFVTAAILSFTVLFAIATENRSAYEKKDHVYLQNENAAPVEVVEKLIYVNDEDDEDEVEELFPEADIDNVVVDGGAGNGTEHETKAEFVPEPAHKPAPTATPKSVPTAIAAKRLIAQRNKKKKQDAVRQKKALIERRKTQEKNKRQWAEIIQHLTEEVVDITDVDLLFNRMLLFTENYIEFDAAAVGMLQDRTLKRIVSLGDDKLCNDQVLAWDSSLIRKLASGKSGINRKQPGKSKKQSDQIYRLDIPLLSNNKIVGIATFLRVQKNFNNFEMNLAFNIVFQSMQALRNSRLNVENDKKRMSGKSDVLCSREQFADIARLELERLNEQRGISLMILEIDHYEVLQEKYGRSVAEKVYGLMARALLSNIRDVDFLGRYGHEGFTCLMCDATAKTAKKLAVQLKNVINQMECKTSAGIIKTTATIGIATAPDHGKDIKSLLRQADINLFSAKGE